MANTERMRILAQILVLARGGKLVMKRRGTDEVINPNALHPEVFADMEDDIDLEITGAGWGELLQEGSDT